MDNLGTLGTTGGVSSPDTLHPSPGHAILSVMDVPDDAELLNAGEVAKLLHVSKSHLPNLRRLGVLRGYKAHGKGWWRYPSNQPAIREALAALRAGGGGS